MLDKHELSTELKRLAHESGFELAGICPALTPSDAIERLRQWIENGYAGQMRYIPDRFEAYKHPGSILDGVRSILMLGMNYGTNTPQPESPTFGRIARYAWGSVDYHDLIRQRLNDLSDTFRALVPEAKVRGVVDTAPLLEREFAQLAGLGWIGKNTMLLNRGEGSWFFLAALLTDQELAYDQPHTTNHCGSCTACLEACPTAAFPAPYVLDANKCISYLTIELREQIPQPFRNQIGDWLFGCDVCQEVCPWNRRAPQSGQAAFFPAEDRNPVDLCSLFRIGDDAFRKRFRSTPLWRSKRRGILRNAAIVLGSQQEPSAVGALVTGLADREPLVRAACVWALAQIGGEEAVAALHRLAHIESASEVIDELKAAGLDVTET